MWNQFVVVKWAEERGINNNVNFYLTTNKSKNVKLPRKHLKQQMRNLLDAGKSVT